MRNLLLAVCAALGLSGQGVFARDATPEPQLLENIKKIKLPPGFAISVYASGLPEARQMAWGEKGVLFVGSFNAGAVYAVTARDGRRVVKTILTGLAMPTGLAFRDGALYVAAVNRILRYDGAEENLDRMPQPKVVYDDLPSNRHHGWKYLAFDKQGRLTFGVGAPCNICDPPKGTAEVRRLDLATGKAETIARGVRNTVGGDFDPRSGRFWFRRTPATGWATTCRPTSSTWSPRKARTTAFPSATRATRPIRNSRAIGSAANSRRPSPISARMSRRSA